MEYSTNERFPRVTSLEEVMQLEVYWSWNGCKAWIYECKAHHRKNKVWVVYFGQKAKLSCSSYNQHLL